MLFRTNTGKLIEINKYDFTNDKLYYQKILEIKKPLEKINNASAKSIISFTKLNN
jgi:hypothetical protein